MLAQWQTHRGDEWWYADNYCKAEGWLSSAYPTHLEITLQTISDSFTEQSLYDFLSLTQNRFPECQLWLTLNPTLKKMMVALKENKRLDWTTIKNPLSESARITKISSNK